MSTPSNARSGVCALLLALAVANSAQAYDRMWSLSGHAGAAFAFDPSLVGFSGAATLGYGINDTLELRVRANARNVRAWEGELSAECVYLLDILEIVPYFGLGIGGGSTLERVATPYGHAYAVVGIDWLPNGTLEHPAFALGLEVRPVALWTRALDSSRESILRIDVSAHASLLF